MQLNKFKSEKVSPSDLNVGDTIEINGKLKTVGCETVKSGFFGTNVDGFRSAEVKRVLFPKWYKGVITGYIPQP